MDTTQLAVRAAPSRIVRRVGAGAGFALTLGALWALPSIVFPDPFPEEYDGLEDVGPVILLGVLVFGLLSLIPARRRRWSAEVPISVGAFSIAAGLAAGIGLLAFGDMDHDEFQPLFDLPWLMLVTGAVTLVGGLALQAATGVSGHHALLRAGVAALGVCAWILVRGASDWILPPYGIDWFVLVALVTALLALVSPPASRTALTPPQRRSRAH